MNDETFPSGDEAEMWLRELLAAGWKPYRTRTMWKAPDGSLYIGPFGAWKAMEAANRRSNDERRE